jgi:transketolase
VPSSTVELAHRVRVDSLVAIHQARASHIGSVLSIADVLGVLYGSVLRVDPARPDWPERDRFLLSKGHACVGLYAALAATGFIDRDTFLTYGRAGSTLMHHVSHTVPGVELSTGSLGHALPVGAGKALAARLRGEDWRTFVLTSDGEWDEGSNWEAALFAAHHGLDNLVVVVDYNDLQSLTTVAGTLALEPFSDKLEAFGWAVREVDGHDHDALQDALSSAPWTPGRPSVVVARTTKGKGVRFMEGQVRYHYTAPDDDQLALALDELGATR